MNILDIESYIDDWLLLSAAIVEKVFVGSNIVIDLNICMYGWVDHLGWDDEKNMCILFAFGLWMSTSLVCDVCTELIVLILLIMLMAVMMCWCLDRLRY